MNVVRLVVWSSIVVIVVLLILAAAAHAQPISESHCCKVWLPVVAAQCEVCPAGYTWAEW